MNKVILLVLITYTSLVCISIPESWPRYNGNLTPAQMYDEAHHILSWRQFLPNHHGFNLLMYTGHLYENYLNTSADQGYEPAIEWRVNRAYTNVVALNQKLSPDALKSLEIEVRDRVTDPAILERCNNFLKLTRAVLSLKKYQ